MRNYWVLFLALLWALPLCAQTEVKSVRVAEHQGATQIILEFADQAKYSVNFLSNPARIVVDIADAHLSGQLPSGEGYPLIKAIRSGARNGNDFRLVLDVDEAAKFRSFPLSPSPNAGELARGLILELNQQSGSKPVVARLPDTRATMVKSSAPPPPRVKVTAKSGKAGASRHFVVAIDAGHGGDDPGAIGPRGIQEKDITLAIARKLAHLVNAEPGMKAVLTRDRDQFLPLRQRIDKARKHKADLFISIHADAFLNTSAAGASVYVLSDRGVTNEASRWLAERENSADLIGGVSLGNKNKMLATVLMDLSQTATLDASMDLGERVLSKLGQVGELHKDKVQRAGFVVLKSPDIPSILVETAFVSNPTEARKLIQPSHQSRLAKAILGGVQNYAEQRRPDVFLAHNEKPAVVKHRIRRGETVSSIAQAYDVNPGQIRQLNRLSSDFIRVGENLQIPAPKG